MRAVSVCSQHRIKKKVYGVPTEFYPALLQIDFATYQVIVDLERINERGESVEVIELIKKPELNSYVDCYIDNGFNQGIPDREYRQDYDPRYLAYSPDRSMLWNKGRIVTQSCLYDLL